MFTFLTFVLASNGLMDLLGSGTAHHDEPFWMEKIKHQGISPFNPNATDYKVFRNVKVSSRIICVLIVLCSSNFQDYGAVGDGVHDDTAAIK
jgi:glucan 1,3-beta-glucosidase